jgi:16S rRNA (adenine1518-N6/adenine1519-N6)-dimethyltransferase
VTTHSPLATPGATRAALGRWGLHLKKSLGQHFLVSDNVVGRILALARVQPGDTVLEIGPGIGTLTEALLRTGARVFAIEKDESLLPALSDLAQRYPDHFTFARADALQWLTRDEAALPKSPKLPELSKLVANLPYEVAASVVLAAFEHLLTLQSVTVMAQREVAERMKAAPGGRDYGAYSVKLQTLAEPTESFLVAPANFMPPPRVSSCVIRLKRRPDSALLSVTPRPSFEKNVSGPDKDAPGLGGHTPKLDEDALGLGGRASKLDAPGLIQAVFTVADAAFYQRRKTIRNSMRAYFSAGCALDFPVAADAVDVMLRQAGIAPTSRGEQHDPETYRKLALALLVARGALAGRCS